MPFVVKDWKDKPDPSTPVSAAAMKDVEKRLSDYSDSLVAGGVAKLAGSWNYFNEDVNNFYYNTEWAGLIDGGDVTRWRFVRHPESGNAHTWDAFDDTDLWNSVMQLKWLSSSAKPHSATGDNTGAELTLFGGSGGTTGQKMTLGQYNFGWRMFFDPGDNYDGMNAFEVYVPKVLSVASSRGYTGHPADAVDPKLGPRDKTDGSDLLMWIDSAGGWAYLRAGNEADGIPRSNGVAKAVGLKLRVTKADGSFLDALTIDPGDYSTQMIQGDQGSFIYTTGHMEFYRTLASDVIITSWSDFNTTTFRFQILGSGQHEWSDGVGGAADTNLYRAAADSLKTDDAFTAAKGFAIGGAIAAGIAYSATQAAADRLVRNRLNLADANDAFHILGDGKHEWGKGGATAVDTTLYRSAADQLATDDDFLVNLAGKGLRVKEGTDAKMGVATLVAGTVTVANKSVTANSRIQLTCQTPGGTPGFLRVSARTAGTSFTILSSSATDTSVVGWFMVEPA